MEDVSKVILKEVPPKVATKFTPPVEPPNGPVTHKAVEARSTGHPKRPSHHWSREVSISS
jgi:hypothetical protein